MSMGAFLFVSDMSSCGCCGVEDAAKRAMAGRGRLYHTDGFVREDLLEAQVGELRSFLPRRWEMGSFQRISVN